jgi:hypothetical protein|tara:strand:- start:484 stop:714 length:231 start_codon:yes stop_codon:yes gene_type:complete
MSEFFLMGVLCLIDPFTGTQHCAYINEDPIVFYSQEQCNKRKDEKATEIAVNLTSRGFTISYLNVTCIVDKKKKNT